MYELMIAYHLLKINKIFSNNPPTSSHRPPHFLHQKTQVEVHHEISEPQSGFPEGMVKRSTGSTPIGGRASCGKGVFSKNKGGDGGKNGRYNIITGFFESNSEFDVFLKQMHELHSLFLMCAFVFCLFSCCFFFVAQVFPRYAHLTQAPAPGHTPPFIQSAGSNGNKSDDAPPLPVPPPPPAPVSAEADSAAVRFGLKGDLRNGSYTPSLKLI